MAETTVAELADHLAGEVRGSGETVLTGCAALDEAEPDQLSFVAAPRYHDRLATTRAGCVILDAALADRHPDRCAIVVDDVAFAFRNAVMKMHGFRPQPGVGIDEEAYLHDTAEVGPLCTIRPHAYVAPRAKIGARVILYPGVYVGKESVIGDDCVLYPGVHVYARCRIGKRVVLHAGTSIGQDGFGYATARDPKEEYEGHRAPLRHHAIPHIGSVVIGDDVELGANCSVDRGQLSDTVIGEGTKASNNVVIGHGCKIGKHNLLVADVGLAGSVTTGDYVSIGGQAGVANHLRVGDHAKIAAGSKVMKDVPAGERWGGMPAKPLADVKREVVVLARLAGERRGSGEAGKRRSEEAKK
ncbi:UDP-3-O-(3-hydroxymyristoyl)glucosamine N-acyltransferase [Phycisphaera mikurensis]|uniref:UDP-3-O-acylglucosamine N-acyltransferase n=1 Tax=Phycisphaera mikurensis (strain NBRC 102666 / KCTC 22515 / FYK2301M01) TaxID=1142394 RepID=I0IGR8_PHYMF|nr:UDP-3-O-(3-hydroxymyristoyl)glucosamine N-acyltransferase [Phycisphaera mikurensis]MBB6443245.1 UDP-3-O-[3-hydroxymyristoyl] glucosamine N-acyltransferase [Phycisphaera mikurensis]BAM04456.1 UDP-3-O-[3-hydroxymyristoyl] glucosamine N-acyltransferase [Phycisphaera mikurensis NBRC 102666]